MASTNWNKRRALRAFSGISATPLTRSSFHADEDFAALRQVRDAALAKGG